MDNQASVFRPAYALVLNHIIFLYVGARVSIPAIFRLISGEPSVDATAIPPWFAVVSLETSCPLISVVNPRTMSESETLKVSTRMNPVVPPIVIFPVTFKFLLTCKS